jgi:serine/threonine-protein kinase RsbW
MKKIILVHKDREFADALSKILSSEGMELVWKESADDAARTMVSQSFDAAVFDINDGEKFSIDDVKILAEAKSDIPMLVTTHYQTPELAFKALGVGADDYLLKPFGTSEILQRLKYLSKMPVEEDTKAPFTTITEKIKTLSDYDDIVAFCMEQLASTLHIADCLIAVRDNEVYKVIHSTGYSPDPVGKSVVIPGDIISSISSIDPDSTQTWGKIVREISTELKIVSHRPFPTFIPVGNTGRDVDAPMGFILGHGAIVMEELDLLELERFISEIGRELILAWKKFGTDMLISGVEKEGSMEIPGVDRLDIVTRVLNDIREYMPDQNDAFWIRLALDEAINNAILHGNRDPLQEPSDPILITWTAGPRKMIVSVQDTGNGFDPDSIPDPTSEENLFSVNGRGIFIMKTVMDAVEFIDPGNRVNLTKEFNGKPINMGILQRVGFGDK